MTTPLNPAMDHGLLYKWKELQRKKAGNFHKVILARISRRYWRRQHLHTTIARAHTHTRTHVIPHWPVFHFGNNHNCPDKSGIRPASSVRRRASVKTKESGETTPCSYQRANAPTSPLFRVENIVGYREDGGSTFLRNEGSKLIYQPQTSRPACPH